MTPMRARPRSAIIGGGVILLALVWRFPVAILLVVLVGAGYWVANRDRRDYRPRFGPCPGYWVANRDRRDYRPRFGPCPGCGVPENAWCRSDCKLLDQMDYR